jgi:hypothetical protein
LLFSTKKKGCKSRVFSLHHLILNLSFSLPCCFYEEVCISSMFYLRHLSLKIESLFIFCFLWRRSLIYHVCFSHTVAFSSHVIMVCFSLTCLSFNYLLISFCLFSMKKNLEDHMSLLSNHSLISLTHISSCCVFFLHHLSLNSKSLHCLVSMKKELLDYVCFSHIISFNTILLAIKSMPF